MSARRLCSAEHSVAVLTPRVWCLAWKHDGRILASCGDDKTVKVWEFCALDKKDAHVNKITSLPGDHSRTIRYVEFSKSGQFLACASFDATITVYEYKEKEFEEVHKLEGHENEIKCCAFSPSDEFLASCSRDKTVWVWQMEDDDYEVGSILQHHTADVKFVVWHPNEEILVSGGYDCSIRFYKFDGEDWITAQAIQDAHEDTIWSGTFDSSGTYFATCGADHYVKIWCLDSSQEDKIWIRLIEYKVNSTRWPLYSISWNPQNGLIAVGGGDCILRILRFDEDNRALTLFAQLRLDAEINCVRWNSKFGDVLAAACDDGTVQFVDVGEE